MDKTYLGRQLAEFSPGIASQPITKVELLDANGDVVGTAGSDTGRTLTASQPDGTDEMAAAILAKVSDYTHIGYEGSSALLDPAVELGDAVTVDGYYLPLITLDMTFDPLLAPNISAPDADELDDEYPYKSQTQRQIERNMAKARSLITKTSEEIMLKVEGLDGEYTELKTTLDGVTVTDSSGTTKIKGSSIETGSLYVNAANITGTLTASQIKTSGIYVGDLADGSSYATKTYVDNNAGLNASEVDSAIETYIDSTSITAEKLQGRYVNLLASNSTVVGKLSITDTTSGYGVAIDTTSYGGGIQLNSGGNVYFESAYNPFILVGADSSTDRPVVSIGGGYLLLSSSYMFGSSLPTYAPYGTVFFLEV